MVCLWTWAVTVKTTACVLLVMFCCLPSSQAQSAATPTRLTVERTTTLRVGELAVLRIPVDRRYTYRGNSGPDGAWRDVLRVVRRSKQQVTFRATATGKGVIILSPDTQDGE